MTQRLFLFVAVVVSTALCACSSSSDNATPDGGSTVPDGGTPTAYERLGGHAGLLAFVKGEVENKVLKDSNLKTYFFNQVATPIPAGHPSAGQIEECFTRLVASVVQAGELSRSPGRRRGQHQHAELHLSRHGRLARGLEDRRQDVRRVYRGHRG